MFKNACYKIKICAYIYFFSNIIVQVYRIIHRFILLGSPKKFLFNICINVVTLIVLHFIIALIIYSFGCVVAFFEMKNLEMNEVSKI